MLGSWYPDFVHIHVFVGIHETIKNVLNFILLMQVHSIQKHPIRDLFWQALRLDESRLPSSCIDTNLKNVQK